MKDCEIGITEKEHILKILTKKIAVLTTYLSMNCVFSHTNKYHQSNCSILENWLRNSCTNETDPEVLIHEDSRATIDV